MANKPTYEELEQRIKELEEEAVKSKQTEETLRATEERFRTIYEESPIGIEIYDPKGQLLHVNKACLDIFGIVDDRQIKGFRLFDDPNLPNKEKGRLRSGKIVRYATAFDFGLVKKHELYDTTKSGIAYLDVVITPLAPKGNDDSGEYLVQVQDKTKRRQAEEALQKAHDELEQRVNKRTAELLKANELLLQEIEERKRAKEALRESEAFTRAVLDNLPIGIAVNSVDPAMKFEYMNDNFPKFYRTTREALADPDAFWNAVYEEPEFREEIKKRVLDDCASGDSKRMYWVDVPITRKGDETSFITARNIPVPDKQLMISTVWDVTERKRSEGALLEAYNIINRSPAVAFLWENAEGWPVEFVSDNVMDIFGYTADEFTSGQVSYVKTVHPDDLERVAEEVSTFSNEQGRSDFYHEPYRIITKDGKVKWVDDRTYIRRDNKGNITHYEGIVVDITDRMQITEALRESEEKYRHLYKNTPVMLHSIDSQGRLLSVSNHWLEVMGYKERMRSLV